MGGSSVPNSDDADAGSSVPGADDADAGADESYQPRPFRSWASARETEAGPSMWTRMRNRISGLFKGPPDAADAASPDGVFVDSSTEGQELEPDAKAARVEDDLDVEWIDSEPPPEPPVVAPPDDFKFPWTRPVAEGATTPETSEPVTTPNAPPEAWVGSFLEAVPEPKKPGLFARLFGRKSGEEETIDEIVLEESALEETAPEESAPEESALEVTAIEDQALEATPPQEAFGSVEQALPAADEPPVAPPPFESTLREKRPSFIGRLFGRKSQEKPSRASLEIEVHQDRIEAAAEALDDVGESTFAPPAEAPPDTEPFAFMNEALPAAPEKPSPPDLSFAPPPAVDATAAVSDIEEKTDEFEIPEIILPEPPVDDGIATLEVSRQSVIARVLGLHKKAQASAPDAAAQTLVEGNPVFLFTKFRAFYNEIIRFKHQKSEFAAGFATAMMTDLTTTTSGPDSAAEALSKKLIEILELQAAEAKWMGGEAADRYPDAQYAMAALADETFTHLEWEGQAAWSKHMVEVKLFRTRASDVELFRRIDRLLKEQPNSKVARDMARVYLLVIAAGFKGKYRPFGLTRALAEYRQRLYEYIHNGDALMLYAPERRIFPDAVSRTLEGHAVSRFTAAQRWAAILIVLIVGYTVVAHVAWSRLSADLTDVTTRITSSNTPSGAR